MKTAMRSARDEMRGGQSTYISFAFIVLFILALLFPIMEYMAWLHDEQLVSSAAMDMARFVAEDFDHNKDAAAQQDFLDRSYPELSTATFSVAVSPETNTSYTHHLPQKSDDPADPDPVWKDRQSHTVSRDVTVEITFFHKWITPLKLALSKPLNGTDEGYDIHAQGTTSLDQTISGGW